MIPDTPSFDVNDYVKFIYEQLRYLALKKELKFVTDFTLNKVRNLGDYFTFQKLIFSEIHPAVAKYISCHIDYLIHLDREKLLQESPLDYSGSEISRFFSLISEQIKKRTKVSSSNIEEIIVKAVEFNFNVLDKPNETLTDFVFEDKNGISIEEVNAKLNYSYYYTYLNRILFSYLKNAKLSTLSKTQFAEILSKIDSINYLENPEELVEYSLNSMADFYNLGDTNKSRVTVNHISNFLQEKNLQNYLKNLESSMVKDSKPSLDIQEALSILFAPVVEPPVSEKPKDEESKIEIVPEEKTNDETIKTDSSGKLEFEKQVNIDPLYNFNEEEETNKSEAKVSSLHTKSKETEKKQAPDKEKVINENTESQDDFVLDESYEDFKTPGRHKRRKEFFSFFTDREIEKIVNTIFNDDREDFANTMEKISNSESYEKATELLKKTFTTYNVNPYSKEAVKLTNSVSNYFEQN
jgi:hypothetical protein